MAVVNRILTLNGSGDVRSNGWLRLTSGTLSGSNHVSLGGGMSWQSGAIETNAAITVVTAGRIDIASAGNDAKLLCGNLTNAGTVTFSTYGNLSIGGTFHNLAGALFDAQTVNRSILQFGGPCDVHQRRRTPQIHPRRQHQLFRRFAGISSSTSPATLPV